MISYLLFFMNFSIQDFVFSASYLFFKRIASLFFSSDKSTGIGIPFIAINASFLIAGITISTSFLNLDTSSSSLSSVCASSSSPACASSPACSSSLFSFSSSPFSFSFFFCSAMSYDSGTNLKFSNIFLVTKT